VAKKTQRQVKELKRQVRALRRDLDRMATAVTGAGAVLNFEAWPTGKAHCPPRT
jgi:hypothetical protein